MTTQSSRWFFPDFMRDSIVGGQVKDIAFNSCFREKLFAIFTVVTGFFGKQADALTSHSVGAGFRCASRSLDAQMRDIGREVDIIPTVAKIHDALHSSGSFRIHGLLPGTQEIFARRSVRATQLEQTRAAVARMRYSTFAQAFALPDP